MTAAQATDPAGFLDRLEEAHRAATPGTWSAEPNYRLEKGCRCLSCWEPIPGSWDIDPIDGPDCPDHGCWHNVSLSEADAAAIVAEHNATPALIAAVRGEWERHQDDGSGFCRFDGLVWPCIAHRELSAILVGEES